MQRRAAGLLGQPDEFIGNERHGAAGAALPWCVARALDDQLADDAPPSVAGLGTIDQKPPEGLGQCARAILGAIGVEVPERRGDLPSALDAAREAPCLRGSFGLRPIGDVRSVTPSDTPCGRPFAAVAAGRANRARRRPSFAGSR